MNYVDFDDLMESGRGKVTLTTGGGGMTFEGSVDAFIVGGGEGASGLQLSLSNLAVQGEDSGADEDNDSFDVRHALEALVDDLDFQAAIDEKAGGEFNGGAAFAYRYVVRRVEKIIESMEVENG